MASSHMNSYLILSTDWSDAKRKIAGRGVAARPAADVQLPVPRGRVPETVAEAGLLPTTCHGA